MTGEEVPDQDQIVHYVKPTKILDDGTVDGSEFCLRTNDEGLSANWLDYFVSSTKPKRLEAIKENIQLAMSPNGRLAEMNVGQVIQHIQGKCDPVRVLHDPRSATDKFGPDPSHCQVLGLPEGGSLEGQLVGDMIAECIQSLHSTIRQ